MNPTEVKENIKKLTTHDPKFLILSSSTTSASINASTYEEVLVEHKKNNSYHFFLSNGLFGEVREKLDTNGADYSIDCSNSVLEPRSILTLIYFKGTPTRITDDTILKLSINWHNNYQTIISKGTVAIKELEDLFTFLNSFRVK